jgi:glycerophosphoryl diester phosphodiesterase
MRQHEDFWEFFSKTGNKKFKNIRTLVPRDKGIINVYIKRKEKDRYQDCYLIEREIAKNKNTLSSKTKRVIFLSFYISNRLLRQYVYQ